MDLHTDKPSFDQLCKLLLSSDNLGSLNTRSPHHGELHIDSIETLGYEFFKIIEPAIIAFEEYLIQEFGSEV